ncbi:hypothetical protein AX16_008940 [Volvariella volvacea WC 439]|nr:hypothetical protein AX16_008940 [Volvariella volvacea WC 439]
MSTTSSAPAITLLASDLPSEIWHAVAGFTNGADIPSLRLCCRRFNAIFTPFCLEKLFLGLNKQPSMKFVHCGKAHSGPFKRVPDIFARHVHTLGVSVGLDLTVESIHAAFPQDQRTWARALQAVSRSLATKLAPRYFAEGPLTERPAPSTILRNPEFWKDLSRFKGLKTLFISLYNPSRLPVASDDLPHFLNNMIDEVARATTNGLTELALEISGFVELKCLPGSLTKFGCLVSLTLKRTCAEHYIDWAGAPPSAERCCASPAIAEQLRAIMENNPHLRSLEYHYSCSQIASRLSLDHILPPALGTMKIEKLKFRGYLLPSPVRTGIAPLFPSLTHLQHLELAPEIYTPGTPLQPLANIDRFWLTLSHSGAELKTLATRYISLASSNTSPPPRG